jgi:hypothetical protein
MFSAAQVVNAVDLYYRCARTSNTSTHFIQQLGKIFDLGLHCCVPDGRFSASEAGGHHYILGSGHGHFFKAKLCTD